MPKAHISQMIDWDAAKADPVEFTKTFLRQADGSRWEPFAAQEAILHGIHRNTSILTGRQFSKTTVLGWYVAWFAVTKPNSEIWILAPTLDQTKIIFLEIKRYFTTTLASALEGKPRNSPFPELYLKNGTNIRCRGLNHPEYVRGNRAHLVVIDEAAFIKEGALKEVVEPLFLVTGKRADSALVQTSTPFGQGDYFDFTINAREQASKGNGRFAYFHYTSYDNPHADREQLEEVKQRYGEDSPIWQAEYMGVFQEDDLAVFSAADIKAAYEAWHDDWKFPLRPLQDHRYIQGVDLANRNDYFVATLLDATDKQSVILSAMDRYKKRGYTFYKKRVRDNYASYNRARTIGDATSLGESVIEDLRDISIMGYEFTGSAAKWEVVQELSRMLQEHRLVLPPPNTAAGREIVTELSYFRYFITPSKNVRIEAPRGKHDDIVMSLALAAHLAVIPSNLGTFRSVNLTPAPAKARTRRSLAEIYAYNPLAE